MIGLFRKKAQRPLIGVTRARDKGGFMTFLNRFALWRAGARSIELKPGQLDKLKDLDGLVIGGGDDVSPSLYGGDLALEVKVDPDRDQFEMAAIRHANGMGLPILGICRGSQLLNVFFKGSIIQDIYLVYKTLPRMWTALPKKIVTTINGTKLNGILGCDNCRVNSLHHQAVKDLGNGLSVAARDEHGVIQAIERQQGPFTIGVQWHPEMLVFDKGQLGLFRSLVQAARS